MKACPIACVSLFALCAEALVAAAPINIDESAVPPYELPELMRFADGRAVLRPADFTGLKSFREDYPEARPVLLYRGKERFLTDGILVQPVDEFLRGLIPGRPPLDAV